MNEKVVSLMASAKKMDEHAESIIRAQHANGVGREWSDARAKGIMVQVVARWLIDSGLLQEVVETSEGKTAKLENLLAFLANDAKVGDKVVREGSIPTWIMQASTQQKRAIKLGLYPEGEKRKKKEEAEEDNSPAPSSEDILKSAGF